MSTEWGLLKTGSVHSLGFSGKLGLSTVWGFGISAIWNPNVHNLGFRRNPTVQCLGTLPFEGCLQNGDVGAALPKPVSILRGIVYSDKEGRSYLRPKGFCHTTLMVTVAV